VLVCFEPLGDKFWVQDTKADGHHAAASFSSDNLEIGACKNRDQLASHISEHINIQFSGLVVQGDKILEQTGTANSRTT